MSEYQPGILAFAGDWHGNTYWGRQMIADAAIKRGVDTIVHTGDYGYRFSTEFQRGIEDACEQYGVRLYFVDGNHDEHDYITSHPLDEDGFRPITHHVFHIPRAHRWEWWGLTWMGLGGATSVDRQWRTPGSEWWPTEAITESQMCEAQEGGPVDVMVTHDCPAGVPIPGITDESGIRYFGAEAIAVANRHRERLRCLATGIKPALWVHGHYHERYDATVNGTHYLGLGMDNTSFNENMKVVTVADLYSDA